MSDTALLQQIFHSAIQTGKRTGVLWDYSLRFYRLDLESGQRYAFIDISSEITTIRTDFNFIGSYRQRILLLLLDSKRFTGLARIDSYSSITFIIGVVSCGCNGQHMSSNSTTTWRNRTP